MNVAAADYKTTRIIESILTTKKNDVQRDQTVEILLRDLSQYDALMEGLVEGVNKIDNVVFSLQN
jgi:hypothetical protein